MYSLFFSPPALLCECEKSTFDFNARLERMGRQLRPFFCTRRSYNCGCRWWRFLKTKMMITNLFCFVLVLNLFCKIVVSQARHSQGRRVWSNSYTLLVFHTPTFQRRVNWLKDRQTDRQTDGNYSTPAAHARRGLIMHSKSSTNFQYHIIAILSSTILHQFTITSFWLYTLE